MKLTYRRMGGVCMIIAEAMFLADLLVFLGVYNILYGKHVLKAFAV